MRKISTLVFILCILFQQNIKSQCTTCTPTFVTTCPAAGGLCNRLDTGYAHLPYLKVMNFYMPPVLTDPSILSQCSCNEVELKSLTVTSVGGLPVGINYVISNNGTFNVAGGDTVGCASFCGTPLAPGLYPVTVYLSANVSAIGTPIGTVNENNVPQQYYDTLLILPDTLGGVTSFTYGNNGFQACDSITVNLNALLSAPQPNFTSYSWQIGNQTSTVQNPGAYTFVNNSTVTDTIPVTLSTTFYNYRVSSVHIDMISGGYCGDIEELLCDCIGPADSPDPYITFPSLGYSNVANYVSNQCSNVNFTGINAVIPLGTDTVQMQLWDKDDGPPFGSPDDLIGTYTLHVLLGQYSYADNNADGYVQFDTVAGTTVTETLYVILNPDPVTPVIAPAQDTFCSGSTVLVTLDSAASYTNCTFQWFRDTVFLSAITDSAFLTSDGGKYKVIVTDQSTGCYVQSSVKNITAAANPPAETIMDGGTQEYLTPALQTGFAVNWYYNGNLVAGQNGHLLPYYGDGVYSAQVYNVSDPACLVNAQTDTILAINRVNAPVYNVGIAPNPNTGNFNLNFNSAAVQNLTIRLQNALGQTVYTNTLTHFSGNYTGPVNVADVSKGIYLLTIEGEKGIFSSKVIVQ